LNFSTVAVFYLLLGSPFIALAQITVYAGAIMVLFLFVIMLLGAEQAAYTGRRPWQERLAIGLGLVLLVEAGYIIFVYGGGTPAGPAPLEALSDPSNLALALYNDYLIPFEITSILLLAAMIGAIVLTRRKRAV
jgi:NADH-quinone oxidoreductase subunit J